MSSATTGIAAYSVAISSSLSSLLEVGLPVLGGPTKEELFPGAVPIGQVGSLHLSQIDNWLIGGAVVPTVGELEQTTSQVYREIFAAVGAKHLVRMWNYVPDINEVGPDSLENYRVFCRGRSLAFESRFGTAFNSLLPSASAVGGPSGSLSVIFAASENQPQHIENPLQVPAYKYPKDYGPRSPSFSRASVASTPKGKRVFISGTAAIRGHLTVAPDLTQDQIACTLENLAVISQACGIGTDLGYSQNGHRHFKVYIRHPEEQGLIARSLEQELFRSGDTVTYLQANICRSSLKVEIEVSISFT